MMENTHVVVLEMLWLRTKHLIKSLHVAVTRPVKVAGLSSNQGEFCICIQSHETICIWKYKGRHIQCTSSKWGAVVSMYWSVSKYS